MNNKWIGRFLKVIEKVGNALPHPATLFALLAVLVLILSWVTSLFDISVSHPATGDTIAPINLLNKEGLHRVIMEMVDNFTGFAPLGTVLVAMLGIGIAEGSGLIGAFLRLIVIKAPERLLTAVLVFAGVMSNIASDVGYVLLVPLGAIIFLAVGRHPIAGLAAAFAGVSGGFSANLLLGTVDPLLQGISQEAARIIEPDYEVTVTCNYYFMVISTFLITGVGTWVTEKVVIPQLGEYKGDAQKEEIRELTREEKRGLWYAVAATVALTALVLIGLLPEGGFLRDLETGGILKSPFLKGIVSFIFVGGALVGVAYGIGAKTFKNDSDVMNAMGKSMETLGIFFVLVFFAAQFVEYFKWTNLGLITAIKGANGLKTFIEWTNIESMFLRTVIIIIPFIIVASLINLVMGSASAKWAIMAPVFIPMMMLLGYSPEFTQVAYRVGDSVTNIIAPMMSYFALIIAFMQRYDKKSGIGTLVATMLPYSFFFFIVWTIMLILWIAFDLPLGPGVSMYL